MSSFYCFAPRFSLRGLGRLRRLLDRDKTQGKRSARFPRNPDRLIDQATLCPFQQRSEEINRRTVGSEPSRILPTRTHNNICAGFEDFPDAVGL